MVNYTEPVDSQELMIPCEKSSNIQAGGVNVVLTAFESFCYGSQIMENAPTTTACWEAIRLIPTRGVIFQKHVNVYCYRLHNIYDFISKQISRCWEKHSPALIVILGQHENYGVNEIVMEKVAGNVHVLTDRMNLLAKATCCTNSGPRSLETELNLKEIVDKLHEANIGIKGKIATTHNGYYLCDYAYYNSLAINRERTACIRVPNNQEVPAEHFADALSLCVSEMLKQLDEKNAV